MKIILLETIENLGRAGEVVNTSDGYFRNFLSPRKLAVPSTEGGLRFLEAKKKQAQEQSERKKQEARDLAAQLEKMSCLMHAKVGQEGKLFGSVTAHDVYEELVKRGIQFERKRIEMSPIHQVGDYHATIKLHPEVEVSLKVSVKA